jgi:class 3 adenylate cyclase
MLESPTTLYTEVGRDHIAYQVIGEGPPDIVFVPHWNTNVEAMWDFPPLARFVRHLATFGRVILFDKRGTGLSDPLSAQGEPLLEQFADDLPAVLDAVGSERVALIAGDAAALVAIVFAASYPERVSSLVLVNAFAGLARAGDGSSDLPGEGVEEHERDYPRIWLDGDITRAAPSLAVDAPAAAQAIRFIRLSAPPTAAYDTRRRILRLDVRDVLPTVQARTLIIHRTENEYFPPTHSRYLASHIEGAKLVEMPGDDHLMYVGDTDAILDEIEVFVTGDRRHTVTDRVLTTVLFTDIVESTDRLAEIGDRRWRELLERHDDVVSQETDRFRGRLVKTTGDGAVATFDGPARAIRCAQAICERTRKLGLAVRSGLHIGEVELREEDVHGLAVHIAQRVSSLAGAGEVLVSRTIVDLAAGSDIEFTDRGDHKLKGVPGTWRLFLTR